MESQRLKELTERELSKIALNHGFTNPRLNFCEATKYGDNFVSQVYRCILTDADLPNKRLDLIVKLPPANEERRKAIRVDGFFDIEIYMYSKVLPALADCYKKRNLIPDFPFPNTGKTYALIAGEEDVIVVMEDLKSKGFVMKDRLVGLDETHCKFVLSNIARLHAASLALQKENPHLHNQLTEKFQENVFHREKMSENFQQAVNSFRDFIGDQFPLGSPPRNKIESFLENYQSNMKDLVRRNSTLSCITHGDLWINNLLFKYKEDSGVLEDLRFIDFQISRMASPITDVAYFLTFCTTGETLGLYMDFLKYYHECLCTSLMSLGHSPEEIVPWNLLLSELRKYGRYGWTVSIALLPVLSMAKEDIENLQKGEGHVVKTHSFFKKKNCEEIKKRFVEIVKQAELLGFL